MSEAVDRRRILAIAALAFIGGLGGGVVFPILPLLGLQLGIAPALVGLILSLNRITRLVANPLTGVLVDRYGARWPLIAGLLVEACATLCFNIGIHSGHPAAWFMGGRALWGVGSSLLMVGALTAALIYSDGSGRGLASARVRMALSTGIPAGLVLGGVVADRYSPGAAFLVASAITFLGMAVALRIAPRGPERRGGDGSTPASSPSLKQLLRPGPLWLVWLFNFCIFFAVQGVILASLVLLLRERHINVHLWGAQGSAGVLMALMIGSSAFVAWVVGRDIDRRRRKAPSTLIGAVLLIGGFSLLSVAHSAVAAAVALMLVGTGLGGINVPLLVIMGDWAPAAAYGRAVGIYQAIGDIGGSLGPIVGIEAMQRFGGGDTLFAMTAFLTLTLPLAGAVWWRERRMGSS